MINKIVYWFFGIALIGFLSTAGTIEAKASPGPYLPFVLPKQELFFSTPLSFTWSDIEFEALIAKLDSVSDFTGQTLTMYVTGTGGVTIAMNNVAEAIERAKAKGLFVKMVVTSLAASGHAYLLCAANQAQIAPGGSIMFHENYAIKGILWGLIMWRAAGDRADKAYSDKIIDRCIASKILEPGDKELLAKGKKITYINENNEISRYVEDDDNRSWFDIFQQVSYLIALIAGGLLLVALIKRV